MMRSFCNLPEEITLNILSRLPAKTVGICRCVSKPWHAMLTHPDFIKTQFQITSSSGQESLIFFDSRYSLLYASLRDAHHLFDKITLSPTKVSFIDYPNNGWNCVHASCNGLLLAENSGRWIYVLNPITREIREVPPSPYPFDPSVEYVIVIYGFGYDSVNDDYKVVTISHCGFDLDDQDNVIKPDPVEMFVDVYSLKSGTWKRGGCSPYDHNVSENRDSGVFVDGFIHWLACGIKDDKAVIAAFDLAQEKFHQVPLPCSIEGDMIGFFQIRLFHLVELDGCLCLFNHIEKYAWVMKKYGVHESWTKFTINDPAGSEEIWILGSLGQSELVFWREENDKLVMYNVEGGTLKDVVAHHSITDDDLCTYVGWCFVFVESLISPNSWW